MLSSTLLQIKSIMYRSGQEKYVTLLFTFGHKLQILLVSHDFSIKNNEEQTMIKRAVLNFYHNYNSKEVNET